MSLNWLALLLYSVSLISFSLASSPSQRVGASSALSPSSQRIYVSGGIDNNSLSNELWSLDVSKSFSLDSPSWTKHATLPRSIAFHFSFYYSQYYYVLAPDSQNQKLALFQYDEKSDHWSDVSSSLKGSIPTARIEFAASLNSNSNSIFILGGREPNVNNQAYAEAYKLDLKNMEWSKLPNIPVDPTLQSQYSIIGASAVTLELPSTNMILFLGGINLNIQTLTSLSNVLALDTASNSWKFIPVSGTAPRLRRSASAIAVKDNTIAYIGGSSHSFESGYQDLGLLDVSSPDNFKWTSIPKFSLPAVMLGSYVQAGDTIFSLFGAANVKQVTLSTGEMVQQALPGKDGKIFGMTSDTWNEITRFTPSESIQGPPSREGKKSSFMLDLKTIIIIVAIVAFILICALFWYLRNKRQSKNTLGKESKLNKEPKDPKLFPTINTSSVHSFYDFDKQQHQQHMEQIAPEPSELHRESRRSTMTSEGKMEVTYPMAPPQSLLSPSPLSPPPRLPLPNENCPYPQKENTSIDRSFYSGNRTDNCKPPLCPGREVLVAKSGAHQDRESTWSTSSLSANDFLNYKQSHKAQISRDTLLEPPSKESPPPSPGIKRGDNLPPPRVSSNRNRHHYDSRWLDVENVSLDRSQSQNPLLHRTLSKFKERDSRLDSLYDPYRDSQLTVDSKCYEDLHELLEMAEQAVDEMGKGCSLTKK